MCVCAKLICYVCDVKQNIKVMTNEDNMNNELESLAAMTEACKLYNVDFKDEAIQYIVDYWTCIA